MQNLRLIFLPIAWVYGAVVWLRNRLYDRGIFKGQSGELPCIVVGNIDTGGTGKTPHVLWLASRLKEQSPAILSRGYGRKTRGFRVVLESDSPEQTGDEPLLYAKNLNLLVVVCEDRVDGVHHIAAMGGANMVLLDDAFQHRRLRADLNIVLVRHDLPPWCNHYLPVGSLRDHRSRLQQADVVIVTNHPLAEGEIKPKNGFEDRIRSKAKLPEATQVFFSGYEYQLPVCVRGTMPQVPETIIVVTGIARPEMLLEHLAHHFTVLRHFNYADHHWFTSHDLDQWKSLALRHPGSAVVTTTKDFVRIEQLGDTGDLSVFIQPIGVVMHNESALLALLTERLRQATERSARHQGIKDHG